MDMRSNFPLQVKYAEPVPKVSIILCGVGALGASAWTATVCANSSQVIAYPTAGSGGELRTPYEKCD